MSEKPSYLGLLNAIALGEQRAHAVLSAWRDATRDRELAHVLNVVAIRENEHAATFSKRLCELGYDLKSSPSTEFDESLALADSDADDDEKFRRILGYGAAGEEGKPDPLANVFDDHTIDPHTGALLGRFIAEERDSERLLRAAWENREPGGAAETDEDSVLADIAERIDRLSRTLEEIKQLRGCPSR